MNTEPKLAVGNWELHGSLDTNATLLEQIETAGKTAATLAVCTPSPYLAQCQSLFTGSAVAWGAQDVSTEARGTLTGEVAASMLPEFGRDCVIVGHSERRSCHDETDARVTAKALCTLEHDIIPIVCVDETPAQREASETGQVVSRQLDAVLGVLSVEQLDHIVVVYEPIWTIDMGKTISSEQAQAVHAFLRARVVARDAGVVRYLAILYGRSVKPDNAGELFAMADIDDGLIDGTSLKAEDFLAIGRA